MRKTIKTTGRAPPGRLRRPSRTDTRRLWSTPLWIGGLIAAAGALGFLGGMFVTLGGSSELDWQAPPQALQDTWLGIDLIAAHPDDPDKPAEAPGATDADIEELNTETVAMLLSTDTIDSATMSGDPRHLFALGRVAMLHDQHEIAYDLLLAAAEEGSVPARMYLALYLDDDPATAQQLLREASAMGFSPAAELLEGLASPLPSDRQQPYQ